MIRRGSSCEVLLPTLTDYRLIEEQGHWGLLSTYLMMSGNVSRMNISRETFWRGIGR